MGLFRSDAQKSTVCFTFCAHHGFPGLWSPWPGKAGDAARWGPSDRAYLLAREQPSRADDLEAVIARVAVGLWDGRGELRFGDIIVSLQSSARKSVDALLEALLQGPDAIDDWVEDHGLEELELDGATLVPDEPPLRKAG